MKLFMQFILVLAMGLIVNTSAFTQHEEHNQELKDPMSWDEAKEAFHQAMAGTFHPAEEGDFKPLREKYKDLIKGAEVWKKFDTPEDLDGEKLGKLIEKLKVDSSKLGKLVTKDASDEELKTAIYALHDVFHEIVGLCSH